MHRIKPQPRFKILLCGLKKSFDLPLAPRSIRPGMEEVDPQIGADQAQVGAGKDLALIGVKLLGQAAAGEGLLEAIEQTAQFFIFVILGVGHQTRTVIEGGEKKGAQHALTEAQSGTIHDVGHPERVGQLSLKGLGRAACFGQQPWAIQALAPQNPVNTGHAEGARRQNPLS